MRVGLIGAYGAIGSIVARELLWRSDLELTVGGRDRERAAAMAEKLGGRAAPRRVDVFDEDSIGDFCRASDIVVNCAGPSHFIGDRIARAAVAQGRHLVDAGGAEAVIPELTRSWREPDRKGLAVIFDAGWIPGVSGVWAHLVEERARAKLERVESIHLFYGDRTAWSLSGVVDIVELARMRPGQGVYREGRFEPRPGGLRRVRLPPPFGSRVGTLSFLSELTRMARSRTDLEVGSWAVPLMSWETALSLAVALLALGRWPEAGGRLVRSAMRRDPKGSDGGFVAAVVKGGIGSKRATLRGCLRVQDTPRLTARACVVAVTMVAQGRLQSVGCRYLCDAVDASEFLGELGVPQAPLTAA